MHSLTTPVLAVLWGLAAPAAAVDDLAVCSRETGDVAIAACSRAIDSGIKGPQLAIAYGSRCVELRNKRNFERAIEDCTKAIQFGSEDAILFSTRADAYWLKKEQDIARALADYSTALVLSQKSNDRMKDHKGTTGELERAVADTTAALELNPNLASAFVIRGMALLRMGSVERAMKDLNTALSLPPNTDDTRWAHTKARETLDQLRKR